MFSSVHSQLSVEAHWVICCVFWLVLAVDTYIIDTVLLAIFFSEIWVWIFFLIIENLSLKIVVENSYIYIYESGQDVVWIYKFFSFGAHNLVIELVILDGNIFTHLFWYWNHHSEINQTWSKDTADKPNITFMGSWKKEKDLSNLRYLTI